MYVCTSFCFQTGNQHFETESHCWQLLFQLLTHIIRICVWFYVSCCDTSILPKRTLTVSHFTHAIRRFFSFFHWMYSPVAETSLIEEKKTTSIKIKPWKSLYCHFGQTFSWCLKSKHLSQPRSQLPIVFFLILFLFIAHIYIVLIIFQTRFSIHRTPGLLLLQPNEDHSILMVYKYYKIKTCV